MITKIDKIENIMSMYGIDCEEAFFAIASKYIDLYVTQFSARLKTICNIGSDIIRKYSISEYHINEIKNIVKHDTKGDMLPLLYQHFLPKKFRESSGKFFTPKQIARAMVELLTPFEGAIIIDPTCGSGTFLLETSEKWGKLSCHLIGNDVDPLLVNLTELSLTIGLPKHHTYGLFNNNIYIPNDENINLCQADFVIANPPFSLAINEFSGESKLFTLGYRNSDALFLDYAFKLLKPSGRLVCLLPHSIITNNEFLNLRKEIEKDWFLLGIITLPENIFYTTAKSTSRADILVLEKIGTNNKPDKIFLCHVPSVGVSLNRHSKSPENELSKLVLSYDIQELLSNRRHLG